MNTAAASRCGFVVDNALPAETGNRWSKEVRLDGRKVAPLSIGGFRIELTGPEGKLAGGYFPDDGIGESRPLLFRP
ncbi:hypothetical protein [uncultured Microbacterium sp.]|uniref:hypothetical protein n=1 Tax=uncultured Microbacterium sp. TaxID=191216 RepID=UPI0025E1F306|nr:hypothetical protein [uncultured Microbacterium sp.]